MRKYSWIFAILFTITLIDSGLTNITVGGLPSPWQVTDIGSVGASGTSSESSGTFTVEGSGSDIWGTSDKFYYVYQTLDGDGEIIARVASIENTNDWAKAGVMIRETLNNKSKHAFTAITPGNGASFQRRTETGQSSSSTGASGQSAPIYLKMSRVGDEFTASYSSDGTNWTAISTVTISMGNSVYVGLAVTSHNDGTLCTAVFDNVAVSVHVTGVSVAPTTLSVTVGQTSDLTETIAPADATDKSVEWSSDDNGIATVDANGLVEGVASGTATITVTTNDGGFSDDCEVTVNCPVLDVPTGLDAIKGIGEVTLTWDEVAGADGYIIKYGTTPGGDYVNSVIVDGGSNTLKVVGSLTNEVTYYFVIVTTIEGNCESSQSGEVSATPSARIYRYVGPNVIISSEGSGKNLGAGINATRIPGQPGGFTGYLVPLSFLIDISAPNAEDNLDACLTFSYDGEDLPEGINIASLDLYRFDEGQSKWVKMNGVHDVDNKTVTLCNIDEFSNWTLAGSVPESVPLANWGIILIGILFGGILVSRIFFS